LVPALRPKRRFAFVALDDFIVLLGRVIWCLDYLFRIVLSSSNGYDLHVSR
jgi:hypothetical protein